MDGSNATIIISDTKVTAITVNQSEKKIFWTDEINGINCANYEGKNKKVLTDSVLNIKSLAFFKNRLFWLLPAYLNHNSSIWTCELADEVCKNHKKISISLQDSVSIKFYLDYNDKTESRVVSPCEKNNGNCSDLCLLIPDNKKNCACQVGHQINSDYQSCRYITECMIYRENKYIKGINLNAIKDGRFTDSFVPTCLFNESLDSIVDFEYDMKNDNLYYTNGKHIYETSIMEYRQPIEVLPGINFGSYLRISNLAFDWLSNNLYFLLVDELGKTSRQMWIGVNKIGQNNLYFLNPIIHYYDYKTCGPPLLFIDVYKGLLFFTDCGNSSKHIYSVNLDVSDKKTVHKFSENQSLDLHFFKDVENTKSYENFGYINA